MSSHDQTNHDAHPPSQRPTALTGSSTILISLCFGLPVVSAAIFGAGLWLGHEWYSPPSLASPALPSPLPAPGTATTSKDKFVAPQPSEPFKDVVVASTPVLPSPSTVPSESLSLRFEPDVEGWRVIQDSADPEDFAMFLTAFPTSHLAAAARTRLLQLQRQQSASPSDDLHEPARALTTVTPQAASSAPLPVTPRQVRYAQISLRLAGFNPGPIDGVLGLWTRVALRQYQASRDIPVTGTLDTMTQQALQIPSQAVLDAYQELLRSGHPSPVVAAPSQTRVRATRQRPAPRAAGPDAEVAELEAILRGDRDPDAESAVKDFPGRPVSSGESTSSVEMQGR